MEPATDAPADLTALSALLGEEAPAGVAAAGQGAVDDLVGLVRTARQAQVDALSQAIDDALRLVPRPLRGVVRRMIT